MKNWLAVVAIIYILPGCKSAEPYTIVSYKSYPVEKKVAKDSAVQQLLLPYNDSVKKFMQKPIGFATSSLTRKQPESSMGNLLADGIRWAAAKQYNRPIDAAFLNSGGFKSYIPKGNVTIETIYTIMPYDNVIVVQAIKGEVLLKLLNHIASRGGWPLSGISMKIVDKKATEVKVNGLPLNLNAKYTIALPDYIVNGGDYTTMLKYIPRENLQYLVRDGLIEYIQHLSASGLPVSATLQNRIVNE